MYSILRKSIKQAKVTTPLVLSKNFREDPLSCLDYKSSNREIAPWLLGKLVWYGLMHDKVYPSQATLARGADCSTKSIQRHLKTLCDNGLVRTTRRFNKSLIYEINPAIRSRDMLEKLSPKVPFFKKLLVMIALSPFCYVAQMYAQKSPVERPKVSIYFEKYIYNQIGISTLVVSSVFSSASPGGDYISEHQILVPPDVGPIILKGNEMETPRVKRLTDEAKLYLIAYPMEVIDEALEKVERIPGIKNRIRWLQSHCSSLCKQRGIAPAWGLESQFKSQMISENPEIFKKSIPFKDLPVARPDIKIPPPRHIKRDHSPVTAEEIAILKATGMWDFLESLKAKTGERGENNV